MATVYDVIQLDLSAERSSAEAQEVYVAGLPVYVARVPSPIRVRINSKSNKPVTIWAPGPVRLPCPQVIERLFFEWDQGSGTADVVVGVGLDFRPEQSEAAERTLLVALAPRRENDQTHMVDVAAQTAYPMLGSGSGPGLLAAKTGKVLGGLFGHQLNRLAAGSSPGYYSNIGTTAPPATQRFIPEYAFLKSQQTPALAGQHFEFRDVIAGFGFSTQARGYYGIGRQYSSGGSSMQEGTDDTWRDEGVFFERRADGWYGVLNCSTAVEGLAGRIRPQIEIGLGDTSDPFESIIRWGWNAQGWPYVQFLVDGVVAGEHVFDGGDNLFWRETDTIQPCVLYDNIGVTGAAVGEMYFGLGGLITLHKVQRAA